MVEELANQAAADQGFVWLRPWRVLLISLGAVIAGAALLPYDDGSVVTPIRLLLIVAGLIAGGWAVKQHLTTAGNELDQRVESSGMLAVYSFAGLVGFLGMAEPWFSGRIFFGFFIAFTIIGSLLALLPRGWRVLGVMAVVVVHFGAIVTASTSAQTSNGQFAWLPSQLSANVYHPYITGLYLTNAYHFYAPDPGSSTLVWIRIEYDDKEHTARWLKFPDRSGSPTPLHYQRLMGICESTRFTTPVEPREFQRLLNRRLSAGNAFPAGPIPLRDDLMYQVQYAPPNVYAKVILSSMARHASRAYPHPTDPSIQVKSVKIYRLTYTIVTPQAMLKGTNPLDDNLKLPFFMGDYDSEGRLLRLDPGTGEVMPAELAVQGLDDPLLYWAVPMEYLKLHAGDVRVIDPDKEK